MNKRKKRRIKITYVFGIFIVLLAIVAVVLYVGSSKVEKTVIKMQTVNDEYIAGQNSIGEMQSVSDYLTGKCRTFIITGDIQYAKDYFKEVQTDQRREKSLREVKRFDRTGTVYTLLMDALNESNTLMEIETYAMRLACEGYRIDPERISPLLTEVSLAAGDRALTAEEQLNKSRGMVFDDNYQETKATINNDIYGSLDVLLEKTRAEEIRNYHKVQHILCLENILLIGLLIVALAILIITALVVIRPMRRSTALIQNNQFLPVKGAAEYAYLAEAYNKMLETTQKHHESLSYEATHDALTGLYNRKYFDTVQSDLADENIAMIIVDIDYFKQINDTYGHETGDDVLRKVSGVLASSFRSEDYVFRIGGDEFVVLMVQMTPALRHVIENKLNQVNDSLDAKGSLVASDGLPPVTLSMGVAFSSGGDPEILFKEADQALYRSKGNGRRQYTFYNDIAKDLS